MLRPLFPDDLVTTDQIRDRLEELESDHEIDGEQTDVGTWDTESQREYTALAEIIDDVCGDNERDSVTLIHERHFRDFIKSDWVESDSGRYAVGTRDGWESISPEDLADMWPFSCIDWQAAADECWPDYTLIEIDGVTYAYMGD